MFIMFTVVVAVMTGVRDVIEKDFPTYTDAFQYMQSFAGFANIVYMSIESDKFTHSFDRFGKFLFETVHTYA